MTGNFRTLGVYMLRTSLGAIFLFSAFLMASPPTFAEDYGGCDSDQQKTVITPSGDGGNIMNLVVFYCSPAKQSVVNIASGNNADKWISVSLGIKGGDDVYDSGRLQKRGDETVGSFPMSRISNSTIRITRWAPGFLGAPGNGGGEYDVAIPQTGDVYIAVTVRD